ncbi:MAG: hypothetical protein IPL46_10170 [Saprospiraceae bacterium]|nr:hypothetical protein [Saprospiraceae bacterium]
MAPLTTPKPLSYRFIIMSGKLEAILTSIRCREIADLLIWDGSHFIHAPSGMFEISVNTIPKGWVFEVENKGASIGPALFNQDFWFDDFSEKTEDERRKIVNNLRPK